jgi:hypothetical protein
MTTSSVARGVKGTIVAAVAACACYGLWKALRGWAENASRAGQGAMGAGWLESAVAGLVGLLSMPLLLWAGMRVLGERGVHLLVPGDLAAWWFLGGRAVEDAHGTAATALLLGLFALLGGLLSLVRTTGD